MSSTVLFLEQFVEDATTLPAELARYLNNIKALDEKATTMQENIEAYVRQMLDLPPVHSVKGDEEGRVKVRLFSAATSAHADRSLPHADRSLPHAGSLAAHALIEAGCKQCCHAPPPSSLHPNPPRFAQSQYEQLLLAMRRDEHMMVQFALEKVQLAQQAYDMLQLYLAEAQQTLKTFEREVEFSPPPQQPPTEYNPFGRQRAEQWDSLEPLPAPA